MGMYDDLSFDHRMPDGYEGGIFQTKSLDCRLDEYVITLAGRLVMEKPWNERSEPIGDMNYSGVLNVISYGRPGALYDLKFIDGTLVEIHCCDTGASQDFYPVIEHENGRLGHETQLPG
jgi:hypothetical protein